MYKTLKFSKFLGALILMLVFGLQAEAQPQHTRLFQVNSAAPDGLSRQYIRHLNTSPSEMFVSLMVTESGNFFGRNYSYPSNKFGRYIARLDDDGIAKWFAHFDNHFGDSPYWNMNTMTSGDLAVTDSSDNLYFIARIDEGGSSTFYDASNNPTSFTASGVTTVLIKLDINGNFVWSKQLDTSGSRIAVFSDSAGDIYLLGEAGNGLNTDGFSIPADGDLSIFAIKFSSSGNLIYGWYHKGITAYSMHGAFDGSNNLFMFFEPTNYPETDYSFGSVHIPTNQNYSMDLLMLELDGNGDPVFGKNFYANNAPGDERYAWTNDAAFDGNDFILMGNYVSDTNTYLNLNNENIPMHYPDTYYDLFLAKIDTSGNVVWETAAYTNDSPQGSYTNFGLDEKGNIYFYYWVRDKFYINNTEYTFDQDGEKFLMKLDSEGAFQYLKQIDLGIQHNKVDPIEDDVINLSGFTNENHIINYPIYQQGGADFYIATFGDLSDHYMTPIWNYEELTTVQIDNNVSGNNYFSFDLVNNVDWTANSDQNWLTLSSTDLWDKGDFNGTISGLGDALITLSAETNHTGTTRTANVHFTGNNGVTPKTVVVNQSSILGLDDHDLSSLTVIYPNPATDILNVKSDRKIQRIEIYDLTGRILKQNKVSEDVEISIDVRNLNSGIYNLRVITKDNIFDTKFVKK